MRRTRLSRVLRGALAASVATFVALLSHVSAGGEMPGALGLAVPWTLSVAVCVLLAGRTLSLPRLLVGTGVSQALFHALFVLGAAPVASTAIPGAHDHHMPGLSIVDAAGSGAAIPAAVGPDALMWAGHALAALVTAVALHRGERAVQRLGAVVLLCLRALRTRVLAALVLPHAAPAGTASVPARDERPAMERVVGRALRRRGPPVAAAS
ncbi:hypothetical protein AB0N73_14675 [Microbacterium sp. NPDC089189]|uniref:hypothetical protein n=1 Tax=Microbacterium sp. NPDC089189 TaxID=3154972 RepID=UPI003414A1A4